MSNNEDSRHNRTYEIAILNLALSSPNKHLDHLIGAMGRYRLFDYPANRVVAQRMKSIWENQRKLDALVLFYELEKNNETIDAIIRVELLECPEIGPGTDFHFFLDELIRLDLSRKTHRFLVDGQRNLKNGEEPRKILDRCQEMVAGLLVNPSSASLSEEWRTHRQSTLSTETMKPRDGVMLNEAARGKWARWFNQHLGERGGLAPGRTLLPGGGPGAGKTGLAAGLVVDALAANLPTAFVQLELSRAETLEHLVYATPYGEGTHWQKIAPRERLETLEMLPGNWEELLDIPLVDDDSYTAESIRSIIYSLASRTEKLRRDGVVDHQANGLVIVDYVQLLTLREVPRGFQPHNVITKAVSMLSRAASENGVCLILLSQLTKGSRDSPSGTSFADADIERVAHAALTLSKPGPKIEGRDADERDIQWTKNRGRFGNPDFEEIVVWKNRALQDFSDHNPDVDPVAITVPDQFRTV